MPPQYIDPTTNKIVDLSSFGNAGAQNMEANRRNYSLAPTESTAPMTITSESIAPTTAINVPPKPAPTPVDTTTGQAIIDAQMKATATPPSETTKPSAIESYLASLKAPTSVAETYTKAAETAGISTAEQDVLAKQKIVKTAQGKLATINAQLGALNAAATAESLKEENRFAPMFKIRGEQANIQRQAAIQVLPLQAQALAAQAEVQSAQGDVELAQNSMKMASDRLTTLFNMQVKDNEATYNYNKDLRDKVYEFATNKEKAQLAKLQKEDDRNFELMKDNINNAQELSKTALASGQADLAARITQLDPKSKTYREDLAMLQGEIKPKVDVQGERIKALQIKKLEQEINQSGGSVNSNVDVNKIDSTAPANVKNTNAITAIIRGNPKIGQGTKTSLSNLLGVVASAEDMALSHPEGTFTGISPFRSLLDIKVPFTDTNIIPFREAGKRTATIQSEEYINGINLRTQIWASGAALTKEQTRQVEGMVPKVTDTDRQVKVKLNELTNFMLSQAKSVLQSEGIDFQPEKVNLFETADLLKNTSPEQKAELEALGLVQK